MKAGDRLQARLAGSALTYLVEVAALEGDLVMVTGPLIRVRRQLRRSEVEVVAQGWPEDPRQMAGQRRSASSGRAGYRDNVHQDANMPPRGVGNPRGGSLARRPPQGPKK